MKYIIFILILFFGMNVLARDWNAIVPIVKKPNQVIINGYVATCKSHCPYEKNLLTHCTWKDDNNITHFSAGHCPIANQKFRQDMYRKYNRFFW